MCHQSSHETLLNSLLQALPTLLHLMGDQSVVVRDSVAWTLGRICEILPQVVIGGKLLQPLVESLLESLKAEPRVAANVCWVSCHANSYLSSLYLVAQSDQLNSFTCHLFIMSKWNCFTLHLLIKVHIIIFKKASLRLHVATDITQFLQLWKELEAV